MTGRRSRFLLVTEYFHPDTAATGQLMTDLAAGLVERGLDLTVFTSQPNYHSGDNERQERISTHLGVPVRRIRAPQLRQNSLPKRLFNWTIFTVWMTVVLAMHRRSDRHLLFTTNPPFLPVAMSFLSGLKGWEYTYIVYDLYPHVITATGYIRPGGFIDRAWTRLNARALRNATNVVVLGPVMRERVMEVTQGDIDESSIEIIHNWADPEFIKPIPRTENPFRHEHGLDEQFTLVYSGNIGANHDLASVIDAARAFESSDVTFLIIGEGDEKATIESKARRYGLVGDTVRFLPYQDVDVLPYSLTAGDVSIVTVKAGMEGLCVSSKLYTALAAGRPVLVISHANDDEARVVESFDAGVQVPQGDTDALVSAIDRWRKDPQFAEQQGRNARRAFEGHFTRTHAVDEYYRVLTGETSANEPDAVEPTEVVS